MRKTLPPIASALALLPMIPEVQAPLQTRTFYKPDYSANNFVSKSLVLALSYPAISSSAKIFIHCENGKSLRLLRSWQ